MCRCVEKNVMANEIAGFGDMNCFLGLLVSRCVGKNKEQLN